MAQYDSATQTRIETSFTHMLRCDRDEPQRFSRLYQLVTWGLFARQGDHMERKQATAAFFRRLAEYADERSQEYPPVRHQDKGDA